MDLDKADTEKLEKELKKEQERQRRILIGKTWKHVPRGFYFRERLLSLISRSRFHKADPKTLGKENQNILKDASAAMELIEEEFDRPALILLPDSDEVFPHLNPFLNPVLKEIPDAKFHKIKLQHPKKDENETPEKKQIIPEDSYLGKLGAAHEIAINFDKNLASKGLPSGTELIEMLLQAAKSIEQECVDSFSQMATALSLTEDNGESYLLKDRRLNEVEGMLRQSKLNYKYNMPPSIEVPPALAEYLDKERAVFGYGAFHRRKVHIHLLSTHPMGVYSTSEEVKKIREETAKHWVPFTVEVITIEKQHLLTQAMEPTDPGWCSQDCKLCQNHEESVMLTEKEKEEEQWNISDTDEIPESLLMACHEKFPSVVKDNVKTEEEPMEETEVDDQPMEEPEKPVEEPVKEPAEWPIDETEDWEDEPVFEKDVIDRLYAMVQNHCTVRIRRRSTSDMGKFN